MALAAQHEQAAVGQALDDLLAVARRGDRIELAGDHQRRHLGRQRLVEVGRHPALRPRLAHRGHALRHQVAEHGAGIFRARLHAVAVLAAYHRQLHAHRHRVLHVAGHQLRQRHQVLVAAGVGLVDQLGQQGARRRHVRVHAHQPGHGFGAQYPVLPFAAGGVAVRHGHRLRAQPGEQRVEFGARVAQLVLARGGLGALGELQGQRIVQVAGEDVAELDGVRHRRIQHDAADRLRVVHRVLLRHAGAVTHAHQVDLRGADRLAHRLEVGDGVGGGVVAQVGLVRQRLRAFRGLCLHRLRRGIEIVLAALRRRAGQQVRLAGTALVHQQDVAALADFLEHRVHRREGLDRGLARTARKQEQRVGRGVGLVVGRQPGDVELDLAAVGSGAILRHLERGALRLQTVAAEDRAQVAGLERQCAEHVRLGRRDGDGRGLGAVGVGVFAGIRLQLPVADQTGDDRQREDGAGLAGHHDAGPSWWFVERKRRSGVVRCDGGFMGRPA